MAVQDSFDFGAGAARTAGIDEAGRGPLAGPVVAAAVILDPNRPIDGLDDSKKLTQERREALFELITTDALAWGIGRAAVEEIDRINILQATLLAMERAVAALGMAPDYALVDGNQCPRRLPCPVDYVIGGDGRVPAIGAASILAKVTRDREMVAMDRAFPGYGFATHKGYSTPAHLEALDRLGPCPTHRRSFAPVRRCVDRVLG